MRRVMFSIVMACWTVLAVLGPAMAQTATLPYDHIHINVPDPAVASAWYEKNFGGRRITEAPDRLMYGSTRLMFLRKADGKPSAASAIGHLGFSVKDIDAEMKKYEANGVKIVRPVQELPGVFKMAFVEDPWGTRIEVVQDADLIGLHHVHLRAQDPEAAFTWLLQKFGGERTKLKGQIDGIKYRATGFSDVWILVAKSNEPVEPSEDHAVDHIGWRSTGPLKDTIDGLRAKGVKVTTEPRPLPLPNGPTIHFSYVAGPEGAKIELVERPGLKPGE